MNITRTAINKIAESRVRIYFALAQTTVSLRTKLNYNSQCMFELETLIKVTTACTDGDTTNLIEILKRKRDLIIADTDNLS